MVQKDMRRSDWSRILRRSDAARDFVFRGKCGRASLMRLYAVASRLTKDYDGEEIVIVGENYAWLQIAVEGENVWATAMYDPEGRFVQVYFDITDGNRFADPEDPAFSDLYLDVVLTPRQKIYVLDEDELIAARESGDISDAQFEKAKAACEGLCAFLRESSAALIDAFGETYRSLREALPEASRADARGIGPQAENF